MRMEKTPIKVLRMKLLHLLERSRAGSYDNKKPHSLMDSIEDQKLP